VSQSRKRPPATITLADRPVYTLDEVAQLFESSWRTIYRLVQRGELRALRIGREWRVSRAEVTRFLNEREMIENPRPRKVAAS
jgi:putative molybdopterin biosynthesis protein